MREKHERSDNGPWMASNFHTTHWSVVLAAGDAGSPGAAEALAELCRVYWYPLYAYVRRRGNGPEDAHDLTQKFFARLLEKNPIAAARRERGQFRGFLLTAIERFLISEWRREQAAKRGGGQAMVSLDEAAAEGRYQLEPADNATPETIFARNWAITVLEQAKDQLRRDYAGSERGEMFDELTQYLHGDRASESFAAVGTRLGMSEAAVKMAVHRLRKRYRDCLHAQVAQTVSTPAEVDEELRYLRSIFSG